MNECDGASTAGVAPGVTRTSEIDRSLAELLKYNMTRPQMVDRIKELSLNVECALERAAELAKVNRKLSEEIEKLKAERGNVSHGLSDITRETPVKSATTFTGWIQGLCENCGKLAREHHGISMSCPGYFVSPEDEEFFDTADLDRAIAESKNDKFASGGEIKVGKTVILDLPDGPEVIIPNESVYKYVASIEIPLIEPSPFEDVVSVQYTDPKSAASTFEDKVMAGFDEGVSKSITEDESEFFDRKMKEAATADVKEVFKALERALADKVVEQFIADWRKPHFKAGERVIFKQVPTVKGVETEVVTVRELQYCLRGGVIAKEHELEKIPIKSTELQEC